MNPFILLSLVFFNSAIRVEKEFFKPGLGEVSTVSVTSKSIYFYSANDGLLSNVDYRGSLNWRRDINTNGKKISASATGVYVLYDDKIMFFNSKGQMDSTLPIIADDIEALDGLYVLKENLLKKYAFRDGSLLFEKTIENSIGLTKEGVIVNHDNERRVVDYTNEEVVLNDTQDDNCDSKNDKICVHLNHHQIKVTNRKGEIVFERDDSHIVSIINVNGIICSIRSSGNIHCLIDNNEVFIKQIEGSGDYVLFSTYDESSYSEEPFGINELQSVLGVVDRTGKILINTTITSITSPIIEIRQIPGGIVVIDSNHQVYTNGVDMSGNFIITKTHIFEIINSTAIPRRSFSNVNDVFTFHPKEVNGFIATALPQREIKIPIALRSIAAVVSNQTISIIEMVSGKILKIISLPEYTQHTECVVTQGFVYCFLTTPKQSTILTVELWEEKVDWEASFYDAYNLPKISISVKTQFIPYVIDKAIMSVSTLGVSTKSLILLSHKHIIAINPKILSGTKPAHEMNKEDQEMSMVPYVAHVNVTKNQLVNQFIDLHVDELKTYPGELESTTLVVSYGIDMYSAQVTPVLSFDSIGDFNYQLLFIVTVVVLALTVFLHFLYKRMN
ncbi:ER membrane protein complex subunit 1 [Entamoeba marina]